MNERTARLRELMDDYGLNAPAVGALLERSAQTVRMWRCESKIIPVHTLTVLELKLKNAKRPKYKAGEAA